MSVQSELKNKYRELFERYKIDPKTGCLKCYPDLKFPTYPYIGSRYGRTKKILIVGLDIGSDETPGRFQCFDERRQAIEKKPVYEHNPHIAGTYFTALFFLKDELKWNECWNKTKNISTCQQALKNGKNLPASNPLSYIALTNYYKFVRKNRKNRAGGQNRNYLDRDFDQKKIVEEVEIFEPDIVVFQSAEFKNKKLVLDRLLNTRRAVYVGPHTSYRKKGGREPEYFVNQILEF